MKIPVLIEPTTEHSNRARGTESILIDVEAETPEAALAMAKQAIEERVASGARIVEVDIPNGNPWLAGAGMFRDDPLFDQWQQAMDEYRQKANEEQDAP